MRRETAMTVLFLALVVIGAHVLTGCNTGELPWAKSEARLKAAKIADRKVELEELTAEWNELMAEAEQDPTPVKVEKAEEAQAEVTEHAKETAKQIRILNELLAKIADSETAIDEVVGQAKGMAEYLPEPWRSIAVAVGAFGLTFWRAKSTAAVLKERNQRVQFAAIDNAYVEAEKVGISLVNSLEPHLTPELKGLLKQGPAVKALVDKAQGKV